MTRGLTDHGEYRTGRKLGRTVYWQYGADADETDRFLGIFDDADIAAMVVGVLNRDLKAAVDCHELRPW